MLNKQYNQTWYKIHTNGENTMTTKRTKYTAEFKAEAIKKIAENKGNITLTAKELGIPMNTLNNWYNKANAGKLKGTENYDSELNQALEENKHLKRQLKVAEEERDILKKATAYFAKVSK